MTELLNQTVEKMECDFLKTEQYERLVLSKDEENKSYFLSKTQFEEGLEPVNDKIADVAYKHKLTSKKVEENTQALAKMAQKLSEKAEKIRLDKVAEHQKLLATNADLKDLYEKVIPQLSLFETNM